MRVPNLKFRSARQRGGEAGRANECTECQVLLLYLAAADVKTPEVLAAQVDQYYKLEKDCDFAARLKNNYLVRESNNQIRLSTCV